MIEPYLPRLLGYDKNMPAARQQRAKRHHRLLYDLEGCPLPITMLQRCWGQSCGQGQDLMWPTRREAQLASWEETARFQSHAEELTKVIDPNVRVMEG